MADVGGVGEVVGVGFGGDFYVWGEGEVLADGGQNAVVLVGGEAGGGATAKVDGVDGVTGVGLGGEGDLVAEGVYKGGDEVFEVGIDVEGAIAAFDGTKGDVEVK